MRVMYDVDRFSEISSEATEVKKSPYPGRDGGYPFQMHN